MSRILKIVTVLFFIFCFYSKSLNAQTPERCGTIENLERLQNEFPELIQQMQHVDSLIRAIEENAGSRSSHHPDILLIPVVVHVVHKTSAQNISDAQILSQIDVLNEDFRRLNTDRTNTPAMFQNIAADTGIEFCLASFDPSGNSTNGITRTSTSENSFSDDNDVKYTSKGGRDAWPRDRYLNIWVCNLEGSLLGYAQFPGGPAATDGVVIDFEFFGRTGTAKSPFDRGRTATHEVGHWLNLRHIWGDQTCGDDLIDDTPVHNDANSGCPSHPKTNTCGGTTNTEMFMNYMDYTDDACMNMFTTGQENRMRAALIQRFNYDVVYLINRTLTGTHRFGALNEMQIEGNVTVTSILPSSPFIQICAPDNVPFTTEPGSDVRFKALNRVVIKNAHFKQGSRVVINGGEITCADNPVAGDIIEGLCDANISARIQGSNEEIQSKIKQIEISETTDLNSDENTISKFSDYKIYPNPNNGTFTINIPNSKPVDVFIYDAMGKVVYAARETQETTIHIDISVYAKGIYLVKVSDGERVNVGKVIHQ